MTENGHGNARERKSLFVNRLAISGGISDFPKVAPKPPGAIFGVRKSFRKFLERFSESQNLSRNFRETFWQSENERRNFWRDFPEEKIVAEISGEFFGMEMIVQKLLRGFSGK